MERIEVEGVPKPDPRPRHRGKRSYKPMDRIKEWVAALDDAFGPPESREPITKPVKLRLEFFLPRPKCHYGTGRNDGVLKASAPRYVTSKQLGDCDNLAKLVQDRMTKAGFWPDDSYVWNLTITKEYADTSTGVRIEIRPLDD